jgi:UDP-glucose 4-epimerase
MRYLITGGSGYIGTLLVAGLTGRPGTDRILVADTRPPRVFGHEVDYRMLDVRDAGQVRGLLEHERADAVVHLAAAGDGDGGSIYDVNVAGTNNVLAAATTVGTRHVMALSTTAVYGRREGVGAPLAEDAPHRAPDDFEYAKHAATADRYCELWAARQQERAMTIVRPAVVLGPRADNFMTRVWTEEPYEARSVDPESELQFVHEDDLVEALVLLLEGGHGGVFNVASSGTLSAGECQRAAGLTARKLPRVGLRGRGRRDAARHALQFLARPAIVSTGHLEQRTGWAARQTSRDAFEAAMGAHGRLSVARHAESHAGAPVRPAPVTDEG